MDRNRLLTALISEFGHQPTEGQMQVMNHLTAFLLSKKPNPIYILKGFAGTGKTTLIGALVRLMEHTGQRFVLMAPTGRAAKVLSAYSGFSSYTIHRKIYRRLIASDGRVSVQRLTNKHRNTVFIVDEASMIGETTTDKGVFGRQNLLDDLISYVFEGANCSMILIGDSAQLPPVGVDESPALDPGFIKASYPVTAYMYELKEVMRQSLESGILYQSTVIRLALDSSMPVSLPLFSPTKFPDVVNVGNDDIEDLLFQAFGNRDPDEAVVVCRSNRNANLYNQAIRSRILGCEEEINAGDLLMIVKNNYYWLEQVDQAAGFLANGDIIRVNRINKIEEVYGFRFADAEVILIDDEQCPPLQVKMLLNTLLVNAPSLGAEEFLKLSTAVEEDYLDIPERRKRLAFVRANPYYNALQVKFSYALTCHKTQGGQWPQVFVEAGIRSVDDVNHEYLRWLYTACTRATKKLYLIGFPEQVTG
jgi:exodeoxyribonuclease-5